MRVCKYRRARARTRDRECGGGPVRGELVKVYLECSPWYSYLCARGECQYSPVPTLLGSAFASKLSQPKLCRLIRSTPRDAAEPALESVAPLLPALFVRSLESPSSDPSKRVLYCRLPRGDNVAPLNPSLFHLVHKQRMGPFKSCHKVSAGLDTCL